MQLFTLATPRVCASKNAKTAITNCENCQQICCNSNNEANKFRYKFFYGRSDKIPDSSTVETKLSKKVWSFKRNANISRRINRKETNKNGHKLTKVKAMPVAFSFSFSFSLSLSFLFLLFEIPYSLAAGRIGATA